MRIHFIGIGGIGTSALARYFLFKGNEVSGSDLVASEITKSLEKLGAKIFIGEHKEKNLPKDTDLVIFSPAVPEDNPEIKKAKKLKIKCQSYPQALGKLTQKNFTIAVCGSHGKSTVAALISLILTKAKFDPNVILGTKLKEFGDSNCRIGKSQYLVIEADEYKESFLNFWPKIIVLLNIEYDHPDYFKNLNQYLLAYKKFLSHLPKDGILVFNEDDKNTKKILKALKISKKIGYSLKEKVAKKIKKVLKIPGDFNVSNALAALKVAKILKIPDKISFKVFSQYKGSWRRFQTKKINFEGKKIILITDYAHHPTQVKETLKAAREKYQKRKIFVIYQPHQYQRTYFLWNDFVKVFKNAPVDKLIITDIYDVAGREEKKIKKKINSEKLVEAINQPFVSYLPKEKIVGYLKKNLKGREVVMIVGAGDIYNLFYKLTHSK